MRRFSRAIRRSAGVFFLLLLACPAVSHAIDVVEPYRWGFDGKVVLNRFNPLSVLVQNNSPEPFDGIVSLRKIVAGPVGERIVEPVYLAPFTSRWVQLYPLVQENQENWRLTFEAQGARHRSFEVSEPRAGEPGSVFLAPADRLGVAVAGMARFEENLFPPLVTATDGLRSVVLSHVPNWDEPRQQAFLDWLRRGGTLHLLHDSRGQFPKFGGVLHVLNDRLKAGHIEAGQIVLHEKTPSEIDEKYLKSRIPSHRQPAASSYNSYSRWGSIDEGIVQHLKDMTKPDHNWFLIYGLSFLYLLVFPGVYLLGRKRWHFGAVYGALLLAVAVFSLGFHQVGKRGYGESTTVHAMALARSIEPGVYDVSQWSHVFVTDGGDYRVAHKATGVLYSSGQSYEMVKGHTKNGAGAEFVADIPPFSGRGLVHRMKVPGPKLSAKLLTPLPPPVGKPVAIVPQPAPFSEQAPEMAVSAAPVLMPDPMSLNQLEIQFEGDLAVIRPPVLAVYRQSVFELQQGGPARGVWRLGSMLGVFPVYFQATEFYNYSNTNFRFGERRDYSNQELFRHLIRPVMQKTLFVEKQDALANASLDEDRVRIFFVAEMPPEFFIDNPSLGKQNGQVVYAFDVLRESHVPTDR